MWLKELTKQKIDANELDQSEEDYELLEEQEFQQLTRVQKVKDSLRQLGEPCKTILEHYYFFKTSMKKLRRCFITLLPNMPKIKSISVLFG